MQEVILAHVQRKLLRAWNIWSITIVALVFLQTILGRFEGAPLPAWWWVLLIILPGTTLLYIGIYWNIVPTKVITLSAFGAVYWLTLVYMLLALGTILAEPFAMQYNDYTLPAYLQLSYTWLLPYNGLLITAYSILFFRKNVLFPVKGNQETILELSTQLNLPTTLKSQCRKYIADNQLPTVFSLLATHYENQLPNEILALQRRYNEIQEEKNNDTIEPATAQRELNRIAISLLKML